MRRCNWCGVFIAKRDDFRTRWISRVGWPNSRWRLTSQILCPHCRKHALMPAAWRRVIG